MYELLQLSLMIAFAAAITGLLLTGVVRVAVIKDRARHSAQERERPREDRRPPRTTG